MQAVATTISAATAVCALLVSIAVYKGQLFELARSLHQDLTTGSVEEARDQVGAVVHGSKVLNADTLPNVRTAYFRILWCFERINAGRARIGNSWIVGSPALEFLDRMIFWHIQEWYENFEEKGFRKQLDQALQRNGMGALKDADSYKAFYEVATNPEPKSKVLSSRNSASPPATRVDAG